MREKRHSYQRGLLAEYVAAAFLILKGYKILFHRYKTPVGEIDLIAQRGKSLIAVEVKAHATNESALNAVTAKSQDRITRALQTLISLNPKYAHCDVRFDVITIMLPFFIRHIDNAWRPRA